MNETTKLKIHHNWYMSYKPFDGGVVFCPFKSHSLGEFQKAYKRDPKSEDELYKYLRKRIYKALVRTVDIRKWYFTNDDGTRKRFNKSHIIIQYVER